MPDSQHNSVNAQKHSPDSDRALLHDWRIGSFTIKGHAVLAPMAGVSDLPFRRLCLQNGAALATGEMTASKPELRNTLKSRLRLAHHEDQEPRIVQIVGTDPQQLADAAIYQVENGAQIIDINMGCPAKKVCNKAAGSALLADEALVERILDRVVASVDVPVTLKIRTGTAPDRINAPAIARIAEQCGIQSLAVHGRTRACKFRGEAEYDTIAEVVNCVSIPVLANGDILSADQAQFVLKKTGATAVMIGRGAQGRPWLFREINDLLNNSQEFCGLLTDKSLNSNGRIDIERLIIDHLREIHQFYDRATDELIKNRPEAAKKRRIPDDSSPRLSVRVARKHICWYFEQLEHMSEALGQETPSLATECSEPSEKKKRRISILPLTVYPGQLKTDAFKSARRRFNQLQCQTSQLEFLDQFFADLRTDLRTDTRTTGVTAA